MNEAPVTARVLRQALAETERGRHRTANGTVMNRAERRERDREMKRAKVPPLEYVERRYFDAIQAAEARGDQAECTKLVADLKARQKYYATHWGVFSDLVEEASVDGDAAGS